MPKTNTEICVSSQKDSQMSIYNINQLHYPQKILKAIESWKIPSSRVKFQEKAQQNQTKSDKVWRKSGKLGEIRQNSTKSNNIAYDRTPALREPFCRRALQTSPRAPAFFLCGPVIAVETDKQTLAFR